MLSTIVSYRISFDSKFALSNIEIIELLAYRWSTKVNNVSNCMFDVPVVLFCRHTMKFPTWSGGMPLFSGMNRMSFNR